MKKILFTLILILLIPLVYAEEEVKTCTYSEEFLAWQSLSNEEQENTIMPNVCKTDEKETTINNITSASIVTSQATYPSSYTTATTSVKDQGSTGMCWIFSANASLESYILKNEGTTTDYSEMHMEYLTTRSFKDGINSNGYTRTLNTGGNFFLSSAYYINQVGPILEKDWPFSEDIEKINLSDIPTTETTEDINDILLFANANGCSQVSSAIKSQLYNNGAVAASIYMDTSSNNYNSKTGAYYYSGSSSFNHAVTIVGWDDNYSKNNFSTKPSSNGAWLVKNSYGTSWGNSGYFYVSYEDSNICSLVSGIEDVDNEFTDYYYNYDELGYNELIGTGETSVGYAATTYERERDYEEISEITVGSYGFSYVDIYIIPDSSELDIDNATLVASTKIPYGGYKTVKLDEPVVLYDDTFSIIVKYTISSDGYPITTSMAISNSFFQNMEVEEGQSFLSFDGHSFSDMATLLDEPMEASIKVGTNAVDSALIIKNEQSNYTFYSNIQETKSLNIISVGISDDEELTYKITNSNNEDNTSSFSFNLLENENNTTTLKITNSLNIEEETYTLTIQKGNLTKKIKIIVSEYIYISSLSANNITTYDGETISPSLTIKPSNATNKTYEYETSNSNIISIEDGTLYSKSLGTATITVKATDGSNTKTTFTVTVKEGIVNDTSYTLSNSYIKNVKEKTSYSSFYNSLNINSNATVKIYNSKNQQINSGYIKTGDKIIKTYATGKVTYYIVIKGDLTGDGKINSADLLRLRQHLLGTNNLSGAYYESALLASGSKINSADLLKLRQYLLGTTKL